MKTLTLILCAAFLSTTIFAQEDDTTVADPGAKKHGRREMMMAMNSGDKTPTPTGRWYLGNEFDGAIFSTAVFERPGMRRELTTIRFSMLNIGYHFNYDFDEHFGMYTGIGIKNIGFIEKVNDSTIKRRVYTIGVPLGFKLGNLQKKHYGFVGGGVDFPFNYREKGFVDRNDKKKFSEWFSDRTDHYMPYIFAGFAYGSGSTVKIQYYPGNFFNTDFEETTDGITTRPYRGFRANLLYITLGLDLHYKAHQKKQAEEPTPAPAEM